MKAIVLKGIEGQRGFKALTQEPQDTKQINAFAADYSRMFPDAVKDAPGTPNGWKNILRAAYTYSVIYSPETEMYIMTEAVFNRLCQQENYKKEYRQNKIEHLRVELYPTDADIIERLAALDEPKSTYIKRLIREDIAAERKDG